jgi:small subunit ribosomal protein S8
MTNDPIADMLTRIRNALMAGMPEVAIPSSKIKVEIARILTDEGYIDGYTLGEEQPVPLISIKLKYFGNRRNRRPVITSLQRISKPGRRVFRGSRDMPRVMSGIGIAIVTTPKGVMTDQEARRRRVGGEVLCYVW